jgi:hypothetical protein
VQLLDPLQVNDRDHPDQQVRVLGDVCLAGDRGAVQSLVEEQVAVRVDVLPWCERPGLLPVGLGLLRVVQILADLAAAVFAVLAKQGLELLEQVGLGREMAEVVIAFSVGDRRRGLHLLPVVPVERVALHDRRVYLLAPEDVLEGSGHRGRARPGRAGDNDDRMLS